MKIVMVTTDNRETVRDYDRAEPEFTTAPQALLQGFAALAGEVEVHVVSCLQQPVRSPAKLAENIFFHTLHVPKIGWLRTGYQGCIRAVRRKVQEIGPDLVHGQGTERECGLSAVGSGRPNVLTVHGNMRLIAKVYPPRPFTFLWCSALLEGLTIPRSAGVICITRYTEDAVRPLARRTWLFPNAVDQSFFKVERAREGESVLLCVATIEERKNQVRLIRALDRIERPGGFEVHFYGRVSPEDDFTREFFELVKARPWCRYAGFADRATLRAQFATARALVLPSMEDNCPMVVLEAMAAGVPVAASAVGGTPELISDGTTGLLFDPTSVESIAAALEKILHQPLPAEAARREARERFYPEVIARKHLAVYREVLSAG